MKKIIDDITKNKVNIELIDVKKTYKLFGITFIKTTRTKHCQNNTIHFESDDIYLFGKIKIYSLIKGKWQRK